MSAFDEITFTTPKRCTIQILIKENDSYRLLGTGILLATKNRRFLISAAHVIEADKLPKIIIPISDNGLSDLGKSILISSSLKGLKSRNQDKVDIAVLELGSDIASRISAPFGYLKYENIEFDHCEKLNSLSYLVFGYPGQDTWYLESKKYLHTHAFILITSISKFDQYDKYNCNKNDHLLLEFPKKLNKLNTGESDVKTPPVNGISGCGVWRIYNENLNKRPIRLIGLLIEFQRKHGRVLIAIRLNMLRLIMQEVFNVFDDESSC